MRKSKVRTQNLNFLSSKSFSVGQFWGAPTHTDIIEFSNFLLQLKNQRSESKTVSGFSTFYSNFEMNYDVGTINKCLPHLPYFKNPPPLPTHPLFLLKNSKLYAVFRGRNSGRLLAKTGSNYHLADSVNVKISERS